MIYFKLIEISNYTSAQKDKWKDVKSSENYVWNKEWYERHYKIQH